jgi:hypothetical protein
MAPVIDQLRGATVAAAAAVGFDQSISVLAQAVPGLDNSFLMQVAEKGGGWVVLLVVLFFYRRDWQRLTDTAIASQQALLAAQAKQAESEQKLAVALNSNTEVIRAWMAERNGERYQERG